MKWRYRIAILLLLFVIVGFCLQLTILRAFPGETPHDKFSRLTLVYRKTLAAFPRLRFRPADTFKELGPPVSTLMKGNTTGPEPQVKRILGWTKFFGITEWIPKSIHFGGKTCVSTTDRNDLAVSDGIVVHPRDLPSKSDLPSIRLPHQRLIYLIQESPWVTGIDVGDYNGVFNWTSTYRRDSDIPYTFFWTGPRDKAMPDAEYGQLISRILSSKTKLIAYMNSNCGASHTKRLDFVKDLKVHVNVDFYGRCGNLECRRDTEECAKTMSQYKFYLALENTHCRHYITEKVHQPLLEWFAVPVVMGGADPSDYETILPPNSYIHSSGFASTQELVDYLLLLDSSPDLYQQYHAWRRTHQKVHVNPWGEICQALHNTSLPIQTYTDFKGWYREDVCLP